MCFPCSLIFPSRNRLSSLNLDASLGDAIPTKNRSKNSYSPSDGLRYRCIVFMEAMQLFPLCTWWSNPWFAIAFPFSNEYPKRNPGPTNFEWLRMRYCVWPSYRYYFMFWWLDTFNRVRLCHGANRFRTFRVDKARDGRSQFSNDCWAHGELMQWENSHYFLNQAILGPLLVITTFSFHMAR